MAVDSVTALAWIFGAAISFLFLYLVIRLAVTHAIRAARPKASDPIVPVPDE